MATDLQYREGLTDAQKNQLVTRLDRIKGGSAITDTDKQNFNYGLGNSWESYLIPNTLSADDVNGSKDITPVNPPNDPTQAFMSGLAGANAQNQAQLTEQQKRLMESQSLYKDAQMIQGVNPDETAYNDRLAQLEEAYKGTMGKGEAYKQQLNQAGVSESEKKLADLNILMAQQQASFQQGMLDTEGKVIPMRFITGQQAQMQKQYAITAGNTAMMAQALQGNITMAKQTAMDTVNLEYADREAKLDMQKQMLELNYDKLTRSEKKRADELSFVLQKEEQRLAEEKALELNKQNLLIQLAPKGIDTATANKIKNAKTDGEFFDAIMAATPYLQQAEDTKGDWSIFEDADGNKMMIEKNTGVIRPATVDSSKNYFTDANGTNWNMTGWATDEDKVQKMQSISDRIGKLTDENLEAKVKQFAPGLTADMVRETSAKTGVSWEALLTMVTQEATVGGQMSNVANKNNNFGGLTWSENTQWRQSPYNGEKGTARPSAEGGNYIKFPTKQAGLDAMGALMAQFGTVVKKEPTQDSEVKSFVSRVNSGKLTDAQALNEITPTKKKALIEALATTPKETDSQDLSNAKAKLITINDISKSGSLNDIVGKGYFDTDWGRFDVAKQFGDYYAVLGNIKNITDQLTLDKLIEAKKAGATFGALSNTELEMLANAATAINNWAIYKNDKGKFVTYSNDGKNELVGYRVDEKSFNKELQKIKDFYNKAIERTGNASYRTMNDGSVWQIDENGNYTQI